MSIFPVEPEMARMIIVASALGCAEQTLVIAAVLSGDKDLLMRPDKDLMAVLHKSCINPYPTYYFIFLIRLFGVVNDPRLCLVKCQM